VSRSFKPEDTERLFNDERVRQWQDIEKVARRKLSMLDAATRLDDLRVPPGNRLEKLWGDRKDQHSIRINDRYRVCFEWREGDAYDVEIVDYHWEGE
jgi:proteic killer suppression protein